RCKAKCWNPLQQSSRKTMPGRPGCWRSWCCCAAPVACGKRRATVPQTVLLMFDQWIQEKQMSAFTEIEALLYDVSRVFLAPVMLLIAAALAYALIVLGMFAVEAWQRRQGSHRSAL